MTYALREARDLAAHALTAPIAPSIALMALAALGLSDDPVHEPVHARDLCVSSSCYLSKYYSRGFTLSGRPDGLSSNPAVVPGYVQ